MIQEVQQRIDGIHQTPFSAGDQQGQPDQHRVYHRERNRMKADRGVAAVSPGRSVALKRAEGAEDRGPLDRLVYHPLRVF